MRFEDGAHVNLRPQACGQQVQPAKLAVQEYRPAFSDMAARSSRNAPASNPQ